MTDIPVNQPVTRVTGAPLDPPAEYTRLREDQPIVKARFPNGSTGWLVTRFEEGSQVFTDPRLSARRPRHDTPEGEIAEAGEDAPFDAGFVMMDEPEHGAYRRLLTARFTPKSVQNKLQPYLDKIVDEHLDAIAAGPETFDFVQAMALPIPCLVICELLGVPYEDRDGFHDATVDLMDMAKSREERDRGAHWLIDYITSLVADKRRTGARDGILAELIHKSDGDDAALTEKQLIGLGVLLLFAGHDTTAAMMGLSTLTLLTHHEQREQMLAHPEKTGTMVEELMRYLTIVQFGLGRVAKEDLELAGAQVKKGDLVVVAMNAANRDPRAFQDPDTLDIDRKMARHMGFGYGVHACLGQNVARAELRTVLPKLFQRFPNLRLATPLEEVPMDFTGTNYGVRKLMVTR
ncbi:MULTISPECIES: cytochrome P450 [Streptomyces]|uniref:Cytochrome P450 n=2 Tax=Streptomyces TaxID=1883 RepID=A0ABU2RCP5_9ACTN|nr:MULTISPECIES: cytochrome P450 [unclassified Streptomyces]EDY43170.1 cytochrome P450 [Streptomyces sp. SPB074]EFK98006.1 cytochrome P450 [Streptomyces sp. SPB78]MDT0413510.1 cytochrome P450 [Streptomyces sp. DSM 41979]MYQ61480.1 cytochrome P450 [Streptomyces sp. SID4926]SCE60356.1 Cytochrome P450 [Streptomyces sp. DfronAA-171]